MDFFSAVHATGQRQSGSLRCRSSRSTPSPSRSVSPPSSPNTPLSMVALMPLRGKGVHEQYETDWSSQTGTDRSFQTEWGYQGGTDWIFQTGIDRIFQTELIPQSVCASQRNDDDNDNPHFWFSEPPILAAAAHDATPPATTAYFDPELLGNVDVEYHKSISEFEEILGTKLSWETTTRTECNAELLVFWSCSQPPLPPPTLTEPSSSAFIGPGAYVNVNPTVLIKDELCRFRWPHRKTHSLVQLR